MAAPGSARDVIVVGGGPAGAAAAVFLRQQGHDVLPESSLHPPRRESLGVGCYLRQGHSAKERADYHTFHKPENSARRGLNMQGSPS